LPRAAPVFMGNGQGYALVRRQGIAAAQDNFSTRFMYTQFHIENSLVPELKRFRHSLLLKGDGRYVSKLPLTDANYGADNYDSLKFPSGFIPKLAGGVATRGQYSGPSYTFNPVKAGDPDS